MEKLIEYEEKYLEKMIDFWIKIYVEENELHTWEEDIKNTFQEIQFLKLWIMIDENEEIIATIGLKNTNEKIELKRLCVKKERRGEGLAKQMMKLALAYSQTYEPNKIICLGTHKKLNTAIKYYEQIGFKMVKTKNDIIFYELKNNK